MEHSDLLHSSIRITPFCSYCISIAQRNARGSHLCCPSIRTGPGVVEIIEKMRDWRVWCDKLSIVCDCRCWIDGLSMVRTVHREWVFVLRDCTEWGNTYSDRLPIVREYWSKTRGLMQGNRQGYLVLLFFEGLFQIEAQCSKLEKELAASRSDFISLISEQRFPLYVFVSLDCVCVTLCAFMHACMCAYYMYVCMYVNQHQEESLFSQEKKSWKQERKNEQTNKQTKKTEKGREDKTGTEELSFNVWMYVSIYVFMFICMHICIWK